MLDFRLYTFLALSDTLNYTKAAQLLCITQPAVSQHIRYLEAKYACKFFVHEGKTLKLTRQGLLLQESVARMVADEKHTLNRLHMEDSQEDCFHFGATLTIGEFLLPNGLAHYLKLHPNTHIRMIVENTTSLIEQMKHGEIQFAFVEGYFKKNEFVHHVLSTQKYVTIKHRDYVLKKEPLLIEDLLDETLIIREQGSGTREILERILNEQNLTPDDFHKTIEIGNINALKHLVKQQLGITFLYEAAVQEELTSGLFEIIPIPDMKHSHEFNFIALKDSSYLTDYIAFYEEIRNFLHSDAFYR